MVNHLEDGCVAKSDVLLLEWRHRIVAAGVQDEFLAIKQLLNLSTVFVVDVKVVYIYECLGIVVCVFPSRIVGLFHLCCGLILGERPVCS